VDDPFQLALEAAPSAMIVVDRSGSIRTANRVAEELLGYAAEGLAGVSVESLVPAASRAAHADFRRGFLADPTTRAMGSGVELAAVRADGTEIPVEIGLNPFVRDGESLTLCSMVDIRARQQAEAQRQQTQRAALEAQRLESLGMLAGGVAHDFNNLLVAVLGNARLAQGTEPNGLVGECLDDIAMAAEQAAELARQLLIYSGRSHRETEPLDVSALVDDCAGLLRSLIRHRATLRIHTQAGLPEVQGDASQLRQVLLNLVGNAADALELGRSGSIYVSTGQLDADASYLAAALPPDLPPGPYVSIEVSDTGAGIEAGMLRRVFEPFVTTKSDGHGLGLAATLGIVRAHGGGIIAYSEPGRGTTMKVVLPTNEDAAAMEEAHQPASSSRRVLVVDDSAMVRRFVRRCLIQRGMEVLEASDGQEALDRYAAQMDAIDLVILDLSMPEIAGEETYRALRRVDPEVRVLLTSGFTEIESVLPFQGKGLAGFLQKPFTQKALRRTIDEVLDEPDEPDDRR